MGSAGAEPGRLKVFISYSRKDEDFAQDLLAGLQVGGFEPYLDKHDIAAGEDWEARLGRLIEAADTVVFVISPDAVASERCAGRSAGPLSRSAFCPSSCIVSTRRRGRRASSS